MTFFELFSRTLMVICGCYAFGVSTVWISDWAHKVLTEKFKWRSNTAVQALLVAWIVFLSAVVSFVMTLEGSK